MKTPLIVLGILFSITLALASFPDGALSLLIVAGFGLLTVVLIRRFSDDSEFLVQLFLGALLVRMGVTLMISEFELYDFFGPDARSYDLWGYKLSELWQGRYASLIGSQGRDLTDISSVGWGMVYLVGTIYYLFGRSMLVAQSFCTVISAATVPMVYFCAKEIFSNRRVARLTTIFVAFFPAMIIWSSQLLKDGLILFFLVTAMTMVLQLQKKLSVPVVAVLVSSLLGILSLRFYIFYIAVAAVVGSIVVGTSSTSQSLIRRTIAVLLLGTAFAYFGVLQNASVDIATYGSLERVEVSRRYAAGAADSGFLEGNVRLDTPSAFLTVVPIRFLYLMLAPFPWEVNNFRQAITVPETFIWWAMIPLGCYGLAYTLRNRFRTAMPALIFTFLLTVAYSLYQGNVGTAYRQRTQIQVFIFIFVAAGFSLILEKREDRKILEQQRRSGPRSGIRSMISPR